MATRELTWHEAQDGGGASYVERRVGDFWLSVDQDDPNGETWDACVEVRTSREGWNEVHHHRASIRISYGHPSRGAAQDAADAMLDELAAPLVATARAEAALAEREAYTKTLVDLHTRLECDVHRPSRGSEAFYVAVGCATGVKLALGALRSPVGEDAAKISNAALAAIAAARGLRVVESELVADVPVLRWFPAESGPNHVASVGRWVLEASTEHWAVMVTYEDGGVKDEVSDGTATGSLEAMCAAQDELRKLGVAFRTE